MLDILRQNRKYRFIFSMLLAILGSLMAAGNALAVPSMARQTGYSCAQCHTVFPELTNFGRQFKLGAYAMTSDKWDDLSLAQKIPVSGGLQISRTSTSDINAGGAAVDGDNATNFPHDRKVVAQTAALYYGGRITENSGALIQYNYDGLEQKWGMEMFDARWAKGTELAGQEFTYGVTLSNNPTVTDVYNSTSAWAFPHTGTAAAKTAAVAAPTKIDMMLASKVAGITAYGWWNDTIYAELGGYRTAKNGAFRFVAAGTNWDDPENQRMAVVDGTAPYWRIAAQKIAGPHLFEVGAYGLTVKLWNDVTDQGLGTNRYRDVAYDARYQYLKGDHSASLSGTVINEKITWNDAVVGGMSSNSSDTLKTVRLDAHYYYQRTVGGGLQYFKTSGSNNQAFYGNSDTLLGSANGSPDTKGWVAELNYLPVQNVKLALRYTKYQQFLGGTGDYSGFGRSASNNNNVYLLGWFMF